MAIYPKSLLFQYGDRLLLALTIKSTLEHWNEIGQECLSLSSKLELYTPH